MSTLNRCGEIDPRRENARAANTGADISGNYETDYTPSKREAVKTDLRSLIGRRIWILAYTVEEARERFADRRQLLRQAGACIILAVLRLAGRCYV